MAKKDLDQWARAKVRTVFIRALSGLSSLAAAQAKLEERRLARLQRKTV